jgi:cytochrome d ubiquinol oxidase subunit I
VRHGVFSGAVLTMWNGHVIPLTYHGLQPQPQPVKAVRRHPNA